MRDGYQPSHLMGVIMDDNYTDMAAWEAENKAFLIKIGQVEETKPSIKSKKEED